MPETRVATETARTLYRADNSPTLGEHSTDGTQRRERGEDPPSVTRSFSMIRLAARPLAREFLQRDFCCASAIEGEIFQGSRGGISLGKRGRCCVNKFLGPEWIRRALHCQSTEHPLTHEVKIQSKFPSGFACDLKCRFERVAFGKFAARTHD